MAACKYLYRVNGLQKVSADVVGAVCEELANSADGLTPKGLVDVSRDVDAPLHGEFEWDDSIAAERFREKQAMGIINNLRIVEVNVQRKTTEPVHVRAFFNIERGTKKYIPLHVVAADADSMGKVIEQARKDLAAIRDKYETLNELQSVIGAINAYLNTVA